MRKPEKKTLALDKNMGGGGGIIGREYPARRKEAAMVEEEPSCVQEEQTETLDPAKCTPEQHAYTVQCTEAGHVLHWARVERHQWSAWEVAHEQGCAYPG